MFEYQYETTARQIKTDYRVNQSKRKSTKTQTRTKSSNTAKANKQKEAMQIKLRFRFQFAFNAIFILVLLSIMMYQNVQISETFSQIQNLKSQATEIKKENEQLEIAIQNELNMDTIEDNARNMLGMQKLTSAQTRYVNLSKKDYVEANSEEFIIESSENIIQKVINKILEIF